MLGERWKQTTENEAMTYARSIKLQREFVIGQIKHVQNIIDCYDRMSLNSLLETTDKIVKQFKKAEISNTEALLCIEWRVISSKLRDSPESARSEAKARMSNLIRQLSNL